MSHQKFESLIWVRILKDSFKVDKFNPDTGEVTEVTENRKSYVLRPLFAEGPVVTHTRYDKALELYRKALRRKFKQWELTRESLTEFLWFTFVPDYSFEEVPLAFEYGKSFINGNFGVLRFTHQGQYYTWLPEFEDLFYISAYPKRQDQEKRAEELLFQLQEWARRYRKAHGENPNLDRFMIKTKGGQACRMIELNLFLRHPKNLLRKYDPDFFGSLLQAQSDFDGMQEIEKVAKDLNELYPYSLRRAYHCEKEVELLGKMVYGEKNTPIVILGPPRSGKSTRLHEAHFRFLRGQPLRKPEKVPILWELDPNRVIAGMSIVGMWQRRFESILKYLLQPNKKFPERKDLLYTSQVIALFRIGKSAQSNMTLADVLKPYLQKQAFQLVLEASPEAWERATELDRGFTDLFKVIRLENPDEETALRIAQRLRIRLEEERGLHLSHPAFLRLVELQRRYFQRKSLVGQIADGLEQLANKYEHKGEVSAEQVEQEFRSQTQLRPEISSPHPLRDVGLELYFGRQIIGQKQAVEAMTRLVHTIKAELNDPERPMGSFLFIGPTGVGKTQLAKVLAQYLFTHAEGLVRFDMNEFIDEQSVSRLVGDFARPEGQLTSKLRYNPNCVLLFDEIEKAHPEVHNLLLQVLGEGRLTDALGRTVSFAGTVIIMTSNLGAERARKEINLMGREDLASSTYRKAVMDFFRPEFINRIDEIVIFDRLSEKHMARIAWLQINGLLKRHGLARRHSLLNLSEDALTQIAARGFDPEFGGRALKRQIEKEMTVLIAEQLVTMPPDNPLILEVDWREGRLQPRVISLEHISRDPAAEVAQPGGEAIEKKHFEALAEKLGELREHILDYEEEQEASWNLLEALQEDASLESLIDIKEEISELEVELKEILWNYETRKKVDLSRANLNLKRLDVRDPYFFADLYNRLHVQDFLHETLQAADYILREGESTYFSLRHKLAWLNYLLSNFVEKGSDLFLLELKPLIRQGLSQREQQYVLDYLASLYADVFPLQEKTQQSGRLFLHFQGPGLLSIFQQEKGVHLAFLSNTQLLPVELILHPLNGEQSPSAFLESYLSEAGDRAPSQPKDRQAKQVKSVVRVYSFEGGGRAAAIWEAACRTARESGEPLPFSRGPNLVKGTITDLRSGLMQHAGLSAEEVRMLFYANFPQPYKFFLP